MKRKDATHWEENKERQHIRVWRSAGHLPWEGEAGFSLQLGSRSPEDEAGTAKCMWKDRSGGQKKKETAGYENKWVRLGGLWGGGCSPCNHTALYHAL